MKSKSILIYCPSQAIRMNEELLRSVDIVLVNSGIAPQFRRGTVNDSDPFSLGKNLVTDGDTVAQL